MFSYYPQRTVLALQAILYIACNASADYPMKAQAVEHALQLSPRKLEGTLRQLSQAHLLQSVAGAGGGYYVSEPQSITLADIMLTVQPTERLTTNFPTPLAVLMASTLHETHQQHMEQLRSITLADMKEKAQQQGLLADARYLHYAI